MFWNRGKSHGDKRRVRNVNNNLDDREARGDKDWAKRYILDPLTAPEPHQLDGPGTSFFNPRRSLSLDYPSYKPEENRVNGLQRRTSNPALSRTTDTPGEPLHIHHPKPISPGRRHSYLPPPNWTSPDAVTFRHKRQGLDATPKQPRLDPEHRQSLTSSAKPPATLQAKDKSNKTLSSATGKENRETRKKPPHTRVSQPVITAAVTQTPEPKSLSSRPSKAKSSRKPPQTYHTQGTADLITEIFAGSTSSAVNAAVSPPDSPKAPSSPVRHTLRRSTLLLSREYDAMASSTRSLDSGVQTQTRHKSSHRHQSRRRGQPLADTIDSMDKTGFGAAYHHGGPYDATLASVNRNKKYAPLEAVKDSNIEALRATPREYIADSLQRHIPLQGTGTIPPGMPDMSGHIMDYEEGADLMREADAPGGAYKRYDFVQYHPDDLKGKGEPSFTIERALKEQQPNRPYRHKVSASYGGSSAIEMKNQFRPLLSPSGGANASLRRQSFSSTTTTGSSWQALPSGKPRSPLGAQGAGIYSTESSLRRNSSTGHRITDGLKRRFGSLRRKSND